MDWPGIKPALLSEFPAVQRWGLTRPRFLIRPLKQEPVSSYRTENTA
jgi:hypothetical protein